MKWPITFLLLLSLFACNTNYSIPSFLYQEIKQVKCHADSLHSYHYTFPKNTKGNLPLLILLDSGGDGLFAIQKVKPAAVNTPCIIVASDLIKNNYPDFIRAIRILIDDATKRFPVANDQVFIGGFSGGSRMAFEYAMRYPVKGVLMCGAGPSGETGDLPFQIYMLAGTTDFNFGEVYYNPLKNSGKNNFISDYFRGGHEWPPAENLKDGLFFLMESQNKDLMKKHSRKLTKKADSLIGQDETLLGINEVEKAIRFDPANRAARKMDKEIREDNRFARKLNRLQSDLQLESRISQAYAQASLTKDSIWWANEIDQLLKETASGKGEKKDHFLRIKAFMGILFFSRINALMSSDPGNMQIEHLLAAYRMAEPENPDVYFNYSLYEKHLGNAYKSDQYLKKAHALQRIKYQKEIQVP